MIRQFLSDVDWGELEYLVIDTPPGTSDEHLSAATYLSNAGLDGKLLLESKSFFQREPKEKAICLQ